MRQQHWIVQRLVRGVMFGIGKTASTLAPSRWWTKRVQGRAKRWHNKCSRGEPFDHLKTCKYKLLKNCWNRIWTKAEITEVTGLYPPSQRKGKILSVLIYPNVLFFAFLRCLFFGKSVESIKILFYGEINLAKNRQNFSEWIQEEVWRFVKYKRHLENIKN